MTLPRALLLLQLGTTLPLVGLIWLIQVVAYPLFARVGAGEFMAYHAAHSRLITFVVGPLMLGELVSSLGGAHFVDPAMPARAARIGAALAIATWVVTAFVSVPQHDVLARGFDARAHAILLGTNWIRTVLWSARGGLLLWVVSRL